ncbi:membrane protein insertase YidC [Parasphaerochaeta coccoides]|uniref:Membrane protein insertase YidC n=1 Tax=Parasphaerochaeta coccoides (strain ATCC BAA-1237 / DSM 17374 / SPN1) TaxID=760011 RepID=F4GI90_PARC1|nr:membrane protein insertase YidC [Parasphaerochaeta coccoides]AEC01249.1 Membrane protein oxaA [Parasphaerochaeta coccoides DSM 17374]
MDKKTILAVVLSVIVISVGMSIQMMLTPPAAQETPVSEVVPVAEPLEEPAIHMISSTDQAWDTGLPGSFIAIGDNPSRSPFIFENEEFIITFDPVGASVSSIKLKKHLDGKEPVEMLFRSPSDHNAFLLYAGGDRTRPLDTVFSYSVSGNEVTFTRNFAVVGEDGRALPGHFTLTKRFRFGGAGEYLFEIKVGATNSENKAVPLSFDNNAYTLAFEPQIGPAFEKLDNYNYRRLYIRNDGGKRTQPKLSNGIYQTTAGISWTAVVGKYFSVIAIPDATRYTTTLAERSDENSTVPQTSSIYLTRPAVRSASFEDTFLFYIGPQLKQNMDIYNKADSNSFQLSELHLEQVLDTSSWLGWLETILKGVLQLFYKVIPNYGVAIILLTLLTRVLMHPLNKKSMASTARMSALSPQMDELRKKYADNPQKLNEATAALYRKEKINPLGGCLPMLLQFPIMIALYGLLNKHFELRGAMFIPGWIPDLSVPDTVLTFSFNLPFLGNQLHILPILYATSMIFSMKLNPSSSGAAGSQASTMKFMMYGMPLILFFTLYNAPSGLLLYWSSVNLISMLQQKFTNKKTVLASAEKDKDAAKTLSFPVNKGKKKK